MSEVRNPPVHDLTPEEVAKGLAENRMLLVDVREPNEVQAEAYPGAVVVPPPSASFCTMGARSAATAYCSGMASMSVAAGTSMAAIICPMRLRLSA